MNALEMLRNFQEIGVRFELAGEGFKAFAAPGTVTTEMCALLKERKSEIVGLLRERKLEESELAWRIDAMRLQLPEASKILPLLFAKLDISPAPDACYSCGEYLKEYETGGCCELCACAKTTLLEVY